jgi:2-polyprenyl-3-methyl-5-hydroxy-6-metoxy-1,4-benzoquinol methylase
VGTQTGSHFSLRERVHDPELMDTRSYPEPVVRGTLDFLTLTNRFFGGNAAVLDPLKAWRPRWSGPVSVLDVGTGGADVPLALAAWARREGVPLRVTAVDLTPGIARLAARRARRFPEIEVRRADLFDVARSGETFDYVTASLFLHHVPEKDLVAALQAMDRLARRGLVVSDLHRRAAGYWAVTVLSRLAGNFVVRHDGPLSVRRAFRPEELDELARRAGLSYLKAEVLPWFRLRLAGQKI